MAEVEVIVKKRGRPKKVVTLNDNGGGTVGLNESTKATTRGKGSPSSTTKKVTTSTSSTSASPASVTTTTTKRKKNVKESAPESEDVPESAPVPEVKTTATRKRVSKTSTSTPVASSSTSTSISVQDAVTKSKTFVGQNEKITSKSSTSTVTKAKKATTSSPPVSTSTVPKSAKVQATAVAETETSSASSSPTFSTILRQVRGFTDVSNELNSNILRCVESIETQRSNMATTIEDDQPRQHQTHFSSNQIDSSSQIKTQSQKQTPKTSTLPRHLFPPSPFPPKNWPKYTIPQSTLTALAARGGGAVTSGTHPYSSGGQPTTTATKLPPRPRHPSSGPRPTEMPLEQLKKNPEFRRLSSRWTKLIFALPVAIVSSWALWEKYKEQQSYQAALQAKKSLQGNNTGTATSTETATMDSVEPVSTETS